MHAGKMAFVSDVARIYALYNFGGIYFDTDVEVVSQFEDLLNGEDAVLGTEAVGQTIGTGFMAFAPGHAICRAMLDYYAGHSFCKQHEDLSNTIILADIIKREYSLSPENVTQKGSDVIIYPPEFFTAYNPRTGKNEKTPNTRCMHHFAASWVKPLKKTKGFCKRMLYRMGIDVRKGRHP